jgi:uncharacterized membrane protein
MDAFPLWLWHPIFVHFTVALLTIGSLLFLVNACAKQARWQLSCMIAARWLFWLGITAAVLTVATGLLAYFTVPHPTEETHALMNTHMIAALSAATLYLALAFWLWRRKQAASGIWTVMLLPALALLAYTAYLGGELVFTHGVGVSAMASASVGEQSGHVHNHGGMEDTHE